jgi:hypothetical protein
MHNLHWKVLLFLSFALSFDVISCSAQVGKPQNLSIGVDIGLPTGQVANLFNFVDGISAKIELPTLNSRLRFVFTAGYSKFISKRDTIYDAANTAYVVTELGAKYYFSSIIYIEADFGTSININSNYISQKIGLEYAPTVGVSIPFNKKNAVDLGIRYDGRVESGGTISQVALRVAYKFNL